MWGNKNPFVYIESVQTFSAASGGCADALCKRDQARAWSCDSLKPENNCRVSAFHRFQAFMPSVLMSASAERQTTGLFLIFEPLGL